MLKSRQIRRSLALVMVLSALSSAAALAADPASTSAGPLRANLSVNYTQDYRGTIVGLYELDLTNLGSGPLHNVTLYPQGCPSFLLVAGDNGDGILAPGQVWRYVCSANAELTPVDVVALVQVDVSALDTQGVPVAALAKLPSAAAAGTTAPVPNSGNEPLIGLMFLELAALVGLLATLTLRAHRRTPVTPTH